MLRKITATALLVSIVSLSVWDVWMAVNDKPGDTISEIIRDSAKANPIVAFVVGLVCGHWFWSAE